MPQQQRPKIDLLYERSLGFQLNCIQGPVRKIVGYFPFRFEFFGGSEKRAVPANEQSRKSSSASSVDASREGRDRRRRNRKRNSRHTSQRRRNTDPDADASSVASPGVVLTTIIDSTSMSFCKTSPVVVSFPISEELETSMTSMTSAVTSSVPKKTTRLSESATRSVTIEMPMLDAVDAISFIDATSNGCVIKIDGSPG